jgi:replicative superfamily II helicase
MSPLDVLQMLGRAGRPGYDDKGYAWVVCDGDSVSRYRELLSEGKRIESRLADRTDSNEQVDGEPPASDLAVHLNAEIALGTVQDIDDAIDWLETTFYYVRARRGSEYVAGDELRSRVSATLEWLVEQGFVEMDGLAVEPTPLGRLTSKFYLELSTARGFATLAERTDISELSVLTAVATAAEFDSVSARSDEEDAIEAVLGRQGDHLEPGNRKVLAILKSAMDGTTPAALRSVAWVIRQNALRLLASLRAIIDRFGTAIQANLVCRVEARVETGVSDDAVGLTAIDGIGSTRAGTLAAAGYDSPADVAGATPSALSAAGLSEGVAEQLVENAPNLPAIAVDWGAFPETIPAGERELREVTVRSTAGSARATVTVTVNGVEMTAKSTYLGEATLPVGVFGGDTADLEFEIRVVFPELPLKPVSRRRTVRVER